MAPSVGGALNTLALSAVSLTAQGGEEGFHRPSLDEFFPGELLFEGTPLAMTRITLVQLLMTTVIVVFFYVAFRKPQLVPRGLQNFGEVCVDFVQVQIIDAVIGTKGQRFLPYLTALFFFILAMNLAGVIPLINVAGTSVVAIPLMLALIAWVVFNTAGIRQPGLRSVPQEQPVPAGRAEAALRAADPDRVRLDLHPAADHTDDPSAGEHDVGALHARAVLQRRELPSLPG